MKIKSRFTHQTRRNSIMKKYSLFALLVIASLILGACTQAATPEATQPPAEPVTLRIAVLPIMDTLPMYVAQQEGLFEKNGIQVEFIPAASAAERDQLIVAGQADGMVNEVVSTIFYNKDSIQVQIVRFARVATADRPSSTSWPRQSGITTVEGLKGVGLASQKAPSSNTSPTACWKPKALPPTRSRPSPFPRSPTA
jgi:NitT/TauT family transport system substrate-binding protein